ncbi:uncharacterized protein METZ01_LOCUS279476, partial [marine metagenome]
VGWLYLIWCVAGPHQSLWAKGIDHTVDQVPQVVVWRRLPQCIEGRYLHHHVIAGGHLAQGHHL